MASDCSLFNGLLKGCMLRSCEMLNCWLNINTIQLIKKNMIVTFNSMVLEKTLA